MATLSTVVPNANAFSIHTNVSGKYIDCTDVPKSETAEGKTVEVVTMFTKLSRLSRYSRNRQTKVGA